MITRRNFLTGAAAAMGFFVLAAPAIVRASSIMRVVAPKPITLEELMADHYARNLQELHAAIADEFFFGSSLVMWSPEGVAKRIDLSKIVSAAWPYRTIKVTA